MSALILSLDCMDGLPTGDKPEPLELSTSLEVSDDIATQMQSVSSKIGNGERRNFDVTELVSAAVVVLLIKEMIVAVVDCLVVAASLQFFSRQFAFYTLGSCWRQEVREKIGAEGTCWLTHRLSDNRRPRSPSTGRFRGIPILHGLHLVFPPLRSAGQYIV